MIDIVPNLLILLFVLLLVAACALIFVLGRMIAKDDLNVPDEEFSPSDSPALENSELSEYAQQLVNSLDTYQYPINVFIDGFIDVSSSFFCYINLDGQEFLGINMADKEVLLTKTGSGETTYLVDGRSTTKKEFEKLFKAFLQDEEFDSDIEELPARPTLEEMINNKLIEAGGIKLVLDPETESYPAIGSRYPAVRELDHGTYRIEKIKDEDSYFERGVKS